MFAKPSLLPLVILLAKQLPAQFVGEAIFLGSSGTTNYAFVDSATGTVYPGSDPLARNVRGAVFGDDGQTLFVGNAAPVFGLTGISQAQLGPGGIWTWSVFYHVPDAGMFLGYDRPRRRLWLLTGNTTTGRQLHCVGADPARPDYQSLIATTTLPNLFRERWALSPSGRLAAVPVGQVASNQFDVVDTNPDSPTFCQVVISVPLSTTSPGSGYITATAIDDRDEYAYVTVPGAAPYLGVLHLASQTWLDFDPAPGQQHLLLAGFTPTSLAVAPDRAFVIVTGGTTPGWAVKVTVDYAQPTATTTTPCLPGIQLFSPQGAAVSFTGDRYSICSSGTTYVIDAATGVVLQNAAYGGLFTAWQDPRPSASYGVFGAGCAGSLGVPTLAPAAASPRPVLGGTFTIELAGMPAGLAFVGTGFGANTWNGLPLPLSLTAYGMPGCALRMAPFTSDLVLGGTTATWSMTLPFDDALCGIPLHQQAFVLDPAANATGVVTSNAGAGQIGL